MIDVASLPASPAGRLRWLVDQENQIAGSVRAALERIVGGCVTAFTGSMTASAVHADITVFDTIPNAWMEFVTDELVDDLGTVNLAGHMSAWLSQAAPDQIPGDFAERFAAVANENALSFVEGATNRLVGAGDSTWQLVRQQVSNSMAEGFTIPELTSKVQGVTGFASQRAETIARTETIGAYVQGDMAGARALGDSGPVEKVWVATGDRRTRPTHVEAHDQCVLLDDRFEVGGP